MLRGQVVRRFAVAAGILGPLLLVAYFATPAFVGWPYAGADPDQLVAYANGHTLLFYAGGWLQVTGAAASILFFLWIVHRSRARGTLAGVVTSTAAAVLLAVVCVEAALLEAVPMAAAAGDRATVATAFALSNGVFARIFGLAPAPLLLGGIGAVLLPGGLLPRFLAWSAIGLSAAFVLSGIAAVFGPVGLIVSIVLSVLQAFWTAGAAITTLVRRPGRPR
ncbi:hypothetical protein [Sinomonas humi]|uniref:DUF4386 family protein n=1 Tax=Sinomonas humi TaxID=1338436 RepID=A0A0B2AI53_9MICC|nr:hypothetical protein [Sinomonas humi]KHL01608.1 hypothetical protein LK10_15295 [Sinomonas humi]